MNVLAEAAVSAVEARGKAIHTHATGCTPCAHEAEIQSQIRRLLQSTSLKDKAPPGTKSSALRGFLASGSGYERPSQEVLLYTARAHNCDTHTCKGVIKVMSPDSQYPTVGALVQGMEDRRGIAEQLVSITSSFMFAA